MKKLLPLLFMLLCATAFAQETQTEYPPVKVPANYSAKFNVIYNVVDDWKGTLDLYQPTDAKGPVPLLIDVHGGGWYHGVKESHYEFDVFFNKGYAVANVEYRLAEQARAPGAIEDVRCALIYLIKNAKEFNVDPNKIVIMGNSSGGHLALITGLLGNNHVFDKNCKGFDGVKVMAIIDKYGGADLRRPEKWDTKSLKIWVKDKIINPAFMSSISPITYVSSDSPPVFIVHGNEDPTIDYQQSVALANTLEEAGVVHKFMTIKGGGHGQFSKEENDDINNNIISFLEKLGINKP